MWGIGCQVSGVTLLGEKFSGEVFSYDDAMGLAVLRTKGDITNTHDVRVLRVEGVQNLKSTPPATAPVLEPLPLVDEARCQKREEASIRAAQASAGECCESIRPKYNHSPSHENPTSHSLSLTRLLFLFSHSLATRLPTRFPLSVVVVHVQPTSEWE